MDTLLQSREATGTPFGSNHAINSLGPLKKALSPARGVAAARCLGARKGNTRESARAEQTPARSQSLKGGLLLPPQQPQRAPNCWCGGKPPVTAGAGGGGNRPAERLPAVRCWCTGGEKCPTSASACWGSPSPSRGIPAHRASRYG